MCEIFFLYSKNGTISSQNLVKILSTAIEEASHSNDDGFGVFNEDNLVMKSKERLGYEHISDILENFRDSKFVVLHLRMATRGKVIVENSHPFKHERNILVHNGTVNPPNNFEKGRTDSYQLLRDIYKRKDKDTVKAITESLEHSHGSVSVFLYDYKDDLYYFRRTSDFTFAEIKDSDLIAGSTVQSRLQSAFSNKRLEFETPEQGKIYKINEDIDEVDSFGLEQSYGRDSVYSHSSRWMPYRDQDIIKETDYEEWKKKKRSRQLHEYKTTD